MLPHPLTNFEIQRYYQNKPRFNGVFSRNNLPKIITDGTYVINLDEQADVGTHWIALFCNRNDIVYFDSFGVEHITEEIKEFIRNKNTKANIFRFINVFNVLITFVQDLLILCQQVKHWLIILVYFLHMILRKTIIQSCLISKMNKCNSTETIDKTNLPNQTKFRLD